MKPVKVTLHTSTLRAIPIEKLPQSGGHSWFAKTQGVTSAMIAMMQGGKWLGGVEFELVHDDDRPIPAMWFALAHRIVTAEGRVVKERNG